MRTAVLTLLAVAAASPSFAASKRPPAYSADIVVISQGKTARSHIWSDGTHVRTLSADGKSGSYADYDRKLSWLYSPERPCLQVPMEPEGAKETTREQPLGNESFGGHPAKKVKVSTTLTYHGRTVSTESTEWRATDLHDLVIRRLNPEGDMHLEHIVAGAPDAKLVAFSTVPCKYDAVTDTAAFAAQAPGGYRKVTFADIACRQLAPLPLAVTIPSDYAIRKAPGGNCLFGADDDLTRVITPKGADFTGIHRGVFWLRLAGDTHFDPATKKFVNEQGPQDRWPDALKRLGATDVTVTPQTVGNIPTLRMTARMKGMKLNMLYVALGSGSPAALINYRAPAAASAKDDEVWSKFVASLAKP